MVANDEGQINTTDNRGFINKVVNDVFPENERNNIVGANGMLSANGLERITNAIFLKAYNDDSLASRLAESLDDAEKNRGVEGTQIKLNKIKFKGVVLNVNRCKRSKNVK